MRVFFATVLLLLAQPAAAQEEGGLSDIVFLGLDVERWALIFTFFMAGGAIAMARSAKQQNKLAKAGLNFAVDQHIAQILVTLHGRWHSEELRDSREKVYHFLKEVQQEIIERNPDMKSVAITHQASQDCPKSLTALSVADIKKYRMMMRVVGFYELAGYLVNAGYIPEKDVIELLGGALLTLGTVFEGHILDMRKLPNSSGKDFEHALALIKAAQKVEAAARRR